MLRAELCLLRRPGSSAALSLSFLLTLTCLVRPLPLSHCLFVARCYLAASWRPAVSEEQQAVNAFQVSLVIFRGGAYL